jgi:RNA polymerase sigma-70 factor (ECF subfamily)
VRVFHVRDSKSFDAFYAGTAKQAVAYVYAITGVLADAEDAVAEAYARAWQRWGKVGAYDDPAGWVRRVAYRVAVSGWRRARNRVAAHQRWGAGRPTAQLNPNIVFLVDVLRRIPAAQRRAVVLHYLFGLSLREIADETDSSVNAVKQRLNRARQSLAPLLGVEDPEARLPPTEVNQRV